MKRVLTLLDLLLGGIAMLSCFYGLYLTGCFGLFDLASQPHKTGLVASLSTLIIFLRLRKIISAQRLSGKWTELKTSIKLETDC